MYIVCPDALHADKLQIIKECAGADHQHPGLPFGYHHVAGDLAPAEIPRALQARVEQDVHYRETLHVSFAWEVRMIA